MQLADFDGMQRLGDTLHDSATSLQGRLRDLSAELAHRTGGVGPYEASAAAALSRRWDGISKDLSELGTAATGAGDAVGQLVTRLRDAQGGLEGVASRARAQALDVVEGPGASVTVSAPAGATADLTSQAGSLQGQADELAGEARRAWAQAASTIGELRLPDTAELLREPAQAAIPDCGDDAVEASLRRVVPIVLAGPTVLEHP